MKAVLQRVQNASVSVQGNVVGAIDQGFLILLGVAMQDQEEDIDYLVHKIAQMRVFSDAEGKMNLDIQSIQGNCLVVSQFTLLAHTKKGNRPSFVDAAPPEKALQFYQLFCDRLSTRIGKKVAQGIFGADMQVSLINDGPVTILLDSTLKH